MHSKHPQPINPSDRRLAAIQHRRDRLGLPQRTNEQLVKNAASPDKKTGARLRAEQAAR